MPFDVAFQLDEVQRCAWAIIYAGFNGVKFDWNRMAFEDDKP